MEGVSYGNIDRCSYIYHNYGRQSYKFIVSSTKLLLSTSINRLSVSKDEYLKREGTVRNLAPRGASVHNFFGLPLVSVMGPDCECGADIFGRSK